jgi:hypothetical protein
MGKLSADEALEFEDHYLTCASCAEVVEKTGRFMGAMRSAGAKSDRTTPLHFTHATEDGLIVSEVVETINGEWLARHVGPQLDGGRVTRTLWEANEYLLESFRQMFPEHICSTNCSR